MADDDGQGYTWETEYERTWEAIKEDESGSLQASVDDIVHRAKRKQFLDRPLNVKLGMMRHIFIIIDMSHAMEDQDLKPTRFRTSLKLLEHFIEELFDQNPIAQIGIITTKDKRAEVITELNGNPKAHIATLRGMKDLVCSGEPSLENSITLALQTLKHVPGHASREIVIIFGSLTTCDPGDISDTIKALKTHNVRCSFIGLAAEVHICKRFSQSTGGRYDVVLDENHLNDLLLQHVTPPPASTQTEASLIRMGFPHHKLSEDKPSLCMCHLESGSLSKLGFSNKGYFCPQCKAKYCELPVECKVCGLTLVSAPQLARSYHHLFPLDQFTEVHINTPDTKTSCSSCQKIVQEPVVYKCEKCMNLVCTDCDIFIHETLHSCPGCASSRSTQLSQANFTSSQ